MGNASRRDASRRFCVGFAQALGDSPFMPALGDEYRVSSIPDIRPDTQHGFTTCKECNAAGIVLNR